MTPLDIEALFTRSTGDYLFARWGRPIAPVVFGVEDATLAVVKGAIEAIVALAGHQMAETDPELGANLMVFFLRDWAELPEVPNLARMIPDLGPLCERLTQAGANQYRSFRFDAEGRIKAAFVFVRMDEDLSGMPADALALNQAAQVICLWSDRAFREHSPLALAGETVILRPEIGAVIRASYDRMMPAVARDPSHALRLAARIGQGGGGDASV
ncbi:hypothetical protein KM031_05835 [Gemmobacter fulvus]|uniref:Uncharacterized protein n=1 Tax=Gemmobacter fulvus TaxID=2840474 RepID=A0A975S2W3_9RHOB|nr:hypothetical protein [Gemmobacter fulvus]MBT9244539.1 hypothetical protein [Gemmobacter fulvus]QWK91403.1 hypothetical protein KM031_05835 [Gemmobacter fulvus]